MTATNSRPPTREPRAGDVRAERERDEVRQREQQRDRDRDLERGRPLAGRERGEGRADGGVALLGAGVAAAHAVGAGRGGRRRRRRRRARAAGGAAGAAAGGAAGAGGTARARVRALRLRRATAGSHRSAGQRGAQAARHGLGVVRVRDRAHDHGAPRARGDDGPDRLRVDPADREPRDRADVRGGVAHRVQADGRAGPPSSASRAPARRRCSRRRSPRRRRPARSSASTARRSRRRRRPRAPRRPACRPGRRGRRRRRPATARSGRSLTMNSAPCARAALRRPRGRGEDLRVGRGLVAELDEVDAAAQRAVERALEARAVRDEVQVRVPEARAAVGSAAAHTHSLASATRSDRRYHRWPEREPTTRAERAAPRPPTVRS